MDKTIEIQKEKDKIVKIFEGVEENKRYLVEGLIEDAAFLYVENRALREVIRRTGMVKVHPEYPNMQKTTEAAKQYLKNANAYAVIIKALNGVLNKNVLEPDDGLDDFLKAHQHD